MADLQFVHFALMPGPVRKQKQFSPADDFPIWANYSLTDKPFRVRFSALFSSFYNTDKPLFRRSVKFGQSKKFQHFLSQRKKSSLTSHCIVKGKISGRIKGFSGLISNGNRTEWSPIRSVIIRVFITSMITGTAQREGLGGL